jgi:hypothetical protein
MHRPPLAAVHAQLRAEVEKVPSTRRRQHAYYPPSGSVLWRTVAHGWVWLLPSAAAVPDLARRGWAEKLASETRVAVAREIAVIFARTFPREVIIRIHLEVFWGEGR